MNPKKFRRKKRLEQTRVAPFGLASHVTAPSDEKTVLKTVPAKVGEVVVGEAILYDDGSVDILIDSDADPDAVALLRSTENDMLNFGYSLGTD